MTDEQFFFGVITRAPEGDPDNLASVFDLWRVVEDRSAANGWTERVEPVIEDGFRGLATLMQLREPVFRVGELLVLDSTGREVSYPGRKPDKWNVDCEIFTDLDRAVTRAREVFLESMREGAAKDES